QNDRPYHPGRWRFARSILTLNDRRKPDKGRISQMSNKTLITDALAAGGGVVRLAPCWVPRSFLMPGGRLKLDPRDLYALGAHRGGIDERWFSSTTKAANGPLTAEDEGLSYIEFNGKKALLLEAIETAGDDFLGAD